MKPNNPRRSHSKSARWVGSHIEYDLMKANQLGLFQAFTNFALKCSVSRRSSNGIRINEEYSVCLVVVFGSSGVFELSNFS